jgi:hypothetical protein
MQLHPVNRPAPKCAAMIGATTFALALAGAAHGADVAWTHARIYVSPDSAAIADGMILIHDGRIAAIGSTAAMNVPAEVKSTDLHHGIRHRVVADQHQSHSRAHRWVESRGRPF